jgi:sporulation protein YlmC with PRC-barrel domain
MFIRYASSTAIAAAMIAMSATNAAAQNQHENVQQTADACFTQMNEFAERMNTDQFWIAGWGTSGYGNPPAPQSTQSPSVVPNPTGTDPAARGSGMAADPRGEIAGIEAPRNQIRALHGAARVLAHRGDNDGCQYLVGKMNEIYDGYAQQLSDAGVDPSEVTGWRQEQLAMAEPLAGEDSEVRYRVDEITGTDVRNPQDENLGSVNDVIIDPQTGEASHLIVARGGFLGIGEEYYAVPFDEVRATAGLETIVIHVSEAEIEAAPGIDPERFRNPQTMMDERRGTDEFWTRRG